MNGSDVGPGIFDDLIHRVRYPFEMKIIKDMKTIRCHIFG